ncbi:hypothetical protein [Marinomonas spartinae]|nr:hypothetical protein [Marinomonas spartinae]
MTPGGLIVSILVNVEIDSSKLIVLSSSFSGLSFPDLIIASIAL